MNRFRATISTATAALATTVLAPAGVAGAGTVDAGEHCVVEVVGQLKSGEYVTTEPACFDDIGDAMAAVGLGANVDTPAEVALAASVLSTTIGVHYDGLNYTGASFSVVGGDCAGGYVNMSATWNNRVSSSISNFCGRLRHWTGYNLTGSWQDTLPNGNLSSPVNNAVSSIQYLN